MKFDYSEGLSIFLFMTFTLVSISEGTESKSKYERQNRRQETMMEYVNTFFSEDSNENDGNRPSREFRFEEKDDKLDTLKEKMVTNQSYATACNSNKLNNEGVSLIFQDWFMISSSSFINEKKFPPVKLRDNSIIKIKIDGNNYRINSAHDGIKDEADKPYGNRYFWFRLSGLHIYYSSTKTDVNVLGAISIKLISTIFNSNGQGSDTEVLYCMIIDDQENNKWRICNPKKEIVQKWSCQIKKSLDIFDPVCHPEIPVNNVTEVVKNITQPIIIIPLPSRHCNDDWDYQQKGDDWECDCIGKQQSPIDLPLSYKTINSPVKPLFQYDEIKVNPGNLRDKKKELKIVYEDNMLKIKYDRLGKIVSIDGTVYYAQEIQIHTPSEHTIDGKIYDMEIQIVHYGMSKGDLAKQATLSFLIEQVPGVYNKFIDDLDFFNLPNQQSKERDIITDLFIPKIFYSADEHSDGSMKPFSFYTYQGSLTSPPCYENTVVYVASKPIPLGSTAIKLFQEAIRTPDLVNSEGEVIVSEQLPYSNRRVQPLYGRPVFYYDHVLYCGPDPDNRKPRPRGHFEKVMKGSTQYFYVDGGEPSGLPGSFVVSHKEANGEEIRIPE